MKKIFFSFWLAQMDSINFYKRALKRALIGKQGGTQWADRGGGLITKYLII